MKKDYKAGAYVRSELAVQADAVPIEVLPDGYISGTASTPTVDLHGHKVLSGAFDESIAKRGLNGNRGVKLLAYHKWDQWAGHIKRLETVEGQLKIAAQLDLELPYVKMLHRVLKQNNGLSFSVGFYLQDFDFVEDEAGPDKDGDTNYILEVRKGDLTEVSVVPFPAQPEAVMDFVKHAETLSDFERALIANGWALSRNDAHKLMQLCRNSIHLFETPMQVPKIASPNRPMLDAHQLKAATDLLAKMRQSLGSH